uniref:Uncharacterized protein n=1 Tax=Schistosoma japonicum TaxID=6182 RepID=Q5C523_SCHJA|nr:unknown [Schistosoma japonicum]
MFSMLSFILMISSLGCFNCVDS